MHVRDQNPASGGRDQTPPLATDIGREPSARKTPEEIAEAIIRRANDGYRHQEKSGYPPFALAPWDDRLRWSAYIKKIAAVVIAEEWPS